MKTLEKINALNEFDADAVSIDESALRLGVSSATIRNWLKTGYLQSGRLGGIALDSIKYFQSEIAGKEKLSQRANKSLKDCHDHDSLTIAFISRAKSGDEAGSSLGEEYQSYLSDSFRNKEGVYYTPSTVVRELFTEPAFDLDCATFCDPCCGSGNFIIHALELGFKPENIYGYDVDPVAVEITKKRIREFCGYESGNIHVADFLKIASGGSACRFDFVYTNPPWGKKLPKAEKEYLGDRLGAGSSMDTSSLFFFACLECLNDNGTLGLLLPEAFFNIASFENARLKSLSLSVSRLVDFGKPFKGLVTKAQAIVLTKKPATPTYKVVCENSDYSMVRPAASFLCNPKSILNLHCDHESAETLESLFSIPHATLTGRALWGLGIVTGNNKKFVRASKLDGYIPVFRGSDISQNRLKQPSSYIPADLSLYQQVAPRQLYEAEEKLIYKFISSRLCFFHDVKQRYVLNSANILIPHEDFPVSTKLLGELLSSDFMNWMFACIFNTSKVLRGDLECLPIYPQFLAGTNDFCESSYLKNLNIEKKSNGTYRIKK